ncbi:MAG: hypothetical protein J6T01_06510, partial [Kiritimatiellae bacterium]|nr:hypothetical protein [Kiritimatiellia bacterium]
LGRAAMDDVLHTRRAQMLGEFLAIPEKLVLYRVGTGLSTSLTGYREPLIRSARARVVCVEQALRELETMRPRIDDGRYRSLKAEFSAEAEKTRDQLELMTAPGWRDRLAAARRQGFRVFSGRGLVVGVYLLPRPLGDLAFNAALRLRFFMRRTVRSAADNLRKFR